MHFKVHAIYYSFSVTIDRFSNHKKRFLIVKPIPLFVSIHNIGILFEIKMSAKLSKLWFLDFDSLVAFNFSLVFPNLVKIKLKERISFSKELLKYILRSSTLFAGR